MTTKTVGTLILLALLIAFGLTACDDDEHTRDSMGEPPPNDPTIITSLKVINRSLETNTRRVVLAQTNIIAGGGLDYIVRDADVNPNSSTVLEIGKAYIFAEGSFIIGGQQTRVWSEDFYPEYGNVYGLYRNGFSMSFEFLETHTSPDAFKIIDKTREGHSPQSTVWVVITAKRDSGGTVGKSSAAMRDPVFIKDSTYRIGLFPEPRLCNIGDGQEFFARGLVGQHRIDLAGIHSADVIMEGGGGSPLTFRIENIVYY